MASALGGQTADLLVVGGAAVGSAVALFCAQDPAFQGRIVVLEADPLYRRCATTRSAASIRHQFSTPESIRLSLFGTQFLRDAPHALAVDGEPAALRLHEGGYLFLATPAGRETLAQNHALACAEGADLAWLDAGALAQRFPWLATDDLAAGTLGLSGEGWFDGHELLAALRRKARALGVVYREGRAVALRREGRRVSGVTLADGSILAAGTVVNAAGTGAAALAATAGIALPVRARKREVFRFSSPAPLPGCPLVIDPSGLYFRPEGEGYIAGIAPPDHDDPDQDPERGDLEPDLRRFDEHLWPLLARRVPGFEALRPQGGWAGHYDLNLFDANAVIGAHPDLDGLLFANGFSGHGLQHAPGIGRAVAELAVHGGFRTLDLSALGWQRVLQGRPLRERNVV